MLWQNILIWFNLHLFVCIGDLLSCMSVYHVYVWCPWRPEEDTGSPETAVIWAMMWVLGVEARCCGSTTSELIPEPPPAPHPQYILNLRPYESKNLWDFFSIFLSLSSTSNHILSFLSKSVMPSRCQKLKKILIPDFVK